MEKLSTKKSMKELSGEKGIQRNRAQEAKPEYIGEKGSLQISEEP